jgi:hypothetical protein
MKDVSTLSPLFVLTLNGFQSVGVVERPPLFSEFLATDTEVRVRFLALPDFLRSSGSGTGSS